MISKLKDFLIYVFMFAAGIGSVYSAIDAPFGIFEIYVYPKNSAEYTEEYFNSLGVANESEYWTAVDTYTGELGLHWVRNVFKISGTSYIPSSYEEKIYRLNKSGLNATATFEVNAPPTNEETYINRIRDTVEAYDNDGDRDLVKPTCIKYWQIENEVNYSTFWSGTPQEYAHLLYIAYEAIKSADPTAKVIIAGEASQGDDGSFYTQIIEELTSNTLYKSSRRFDIADIHIYGAANDYMDIETYSDRFRDYLTGTIYEGVPLWIMECGTFTGDPEQLPYTSQTEEQQARSLIKRYIIGFKSNVEKIFWAPGLVETYAIGGTPDNFFDFMGLIYNGLPSDETQDRGSWKKKSSFYSYKLLLQAMGKNVNYLGDLSLGLPNVYGYKFNCDSRIYYVLWSEVGDEEVSFVVSTPTVNVTNLLVDSVTSETIQYQLDRDINNEITLTVGSDPLLVYEIVSPTPTPSSDILPYFPFTYAEQVISSAGTFEVVDVKIPPNILSADPTTTETADAIIGEYNDKALRIIAHISNTSIVLDMGLDTELRDGAGNDISIVKSGGIAPLKIEASNDSTFGTGVQLVGNIPANNLRNSIAFDIGNNDNAKYRYVKLTKDKTSVGFIDIERIQLINYGEPPPTPTPTEVPIYFREPLSAD